MDNTAYDFDEEDLDATNSMMKAPDAILAKEISVPVNRLNVKIRIDNSYNK